MNNSSKVYVVEETEIVIYAEVGYMEGLSSANSKETHKQYEAILTSGSKCRVRETTNEGNVNYIYTLKNKNKENEFNNVSSSLEYNLEVDKSLFDGFKEAANKLVEKYRYTFLHDVNIIVDDIPIIVKNVKYEVDLFFKSKENIDTPIGSRWCKIDIEIDSINKLLEEKYPDRTEIKFTISISNLPFKPMNSIMLSTATEEQRNKIKELWEYEFSTILIS